MKKLVFATNNNHKLAEVRQIIGEIYDVLSLNDIGCHEELPETHDTLEGNALEKARYVSEHYHCDCFADDTGLEVTVLGGAPEYSRHAMPPCQRTSLQTGRTDGEQLTTTTLKPTCANCLTR